jgi:flavin reductase (DIM6/NTAB) family NADH-FMN oxidoreductase RutF
VDSRRGIRPAKGTSKIPMTEPPPNIAFRETLSRFASGVVVVAAHASEGPVGITASAFSSVSLDPPLVLVCVGHQASAYKRLVEAPFFGISVLSRAQESVAARRGANRFAGIAFEPHWRVPLIAGAVAHIECSPHALYEAGDHTILVGRVLRTSVAAGAPLLHFNHRYGDFAHRAPDRDERDSLAALVQAATRDDLAALRAMESEAP